MADSTPSSARNAQNRWISVVADSDVIRYIMWAGALVAITVASTAEVVRQAEARAPLDLSNHYLARWAIVSAGSLLLVSLLGGLLVFRRETKWEVAATWPLLGGIVVGAGSFITLSVMGQTDPGTVSCTGPQPCDTAFGLGAGVLSLVAAIPIGAVFIGTYSLKRLASHFRGHRAR